MNDLISRQAAIDALNEYFSRIGKLKRRGLNKGEKAISLDTVGTINSLPSAQPESHYCRECKWGRCHINVDKHSKSETYWRCLNWDGETDEEGYCYEWERRTE